MGGGRHGRDSWEDRGRKWRSGFINLGSLVVRRLKTVVALGGLFVVRLGGNIREIRHKPGSRLGFGIRVIGSGPCHNTSYLLPMYSLGFSCRVFSRSTNHAQHGPPHLLQRDTLRVKKNIICSAFL